MTADATWLASMPEIYDRELGPAIFRPPARELARRAALRRPARILELAAGTGVGTAELVAALPDAAVLATDLNEAMVAYGAAKVPGATWRQADAQAVDLPDDSFDLVACQFGVMFFPDKPKVFAEAARVLTPEGALLLSVWDTVETSDITAALVESLAAVLPEDPPSFFVRIPHGYSDPDRIAADLQAGGLQLLDIERVVLRGSTPSARRVAAGFCLGTPLRFALAERGPLEAVTEAVADEMEARLGTGPVEGALAAFLVTAAVGGG